MTSSARFPAVTWALATFAIAAGGTTQSSPPRKEVATDPIPHAVGRSAPSTAGLRWLPPVGTPRVATPSAETATEPRPPGAPPRRTSPHSHPAPPTRAELGRVRLLIGGRALLEPADPPWLERLRSAVRDQRLQVELIGQRGGAPDETWSELRAHWPRAFVAIDPDRRTANALGIEPATDWVAWIDGHGLIASLGSGKQLTERTRAEFESDGSTLLRRRINPLVGQAFGKLTALQPLDGPSPKSNPLDFSIKDRPLTLFRWWTVGCPHCRASLPALDRLAKRFQGRGLQFVAVYHPKSRNVPSPAALREYLDNLGVRHAHTARDDQWIKLRDLMQRGQLRRATSVSFLVDRTGKVRWVHPGPRVHPSKNPRWATPAEDYADLERLIDGLLPPAPAKTHDG